MSLPPTVDDITGEQYPEGAQRTCQSSSQHPTSTRVWNPSRGIIFAQGERPTVHHRTYHAPIGERSSQQRAEYATKQPALKTASSAKIPIPAPVLLDYKRQARASKLQRKATSGDLGEDDTLAMIRALKKAKPQETASNTKRAQTDSESATARIKASSAPAVAASTAVKASKTFASEVRGPASNTAPIPAQPQQQAEKKALPVKPLTEAAQTSEQEKSTKMPKAVVAQTKQKEALGAEVRSGAAGSSMPSVVPPQDAATLSTQVSPSFLDENVNERIMKLNAPPKKAPKLKAASSSADPDNMSLAPAAVRQVAREVGPLHDEEQHSLSQRWARNRLIDAEDAAVERAERRKDYEGYRAVFQDVRAAVGSVITILGALRYGSWAESQNWAKHLEHARSLCKELDTVEEGLSLHVKAVELISTLKASCGTTIPLLNALQVLAYLKEQHWHYIGTEMWNRDHDFSREAHYSRELTKHVRYHMDPQRGFPECYAHQNLRQRLRIPFRNFMDGAVELQYTVRVLDRCKPPNPYAPGIIKVTWPSGFGDNIRNRSGPVFKLLASMRTIAKKYSQRAHGMNKEATGENGVCERILLSWLQTQSLMEQERYRIMQPFYELMRSQNEILGATRAAQQHFESYYHGFMPAQLRNIIKAANAFGGVYKEELQIPDEITEYDRLAYRRLMVEEQNGELEPRAPEVKQFLTDRLETMRRAAREQQRARTLQSSRTRKPMKSASTSTSQPQGAFRIRRIQGWKGVGIKKTQSSSLRASNAANVRARIRTRARSAAKADDKPKTATPLLKNVPEKQAFPRTRTMNRRERRAMARATAKAASQEETAASTEVKVHDQAADNAPQVIPDWVKKKRARRAERLAKKRSEKKAKKRAAAATEKYSVDTAGKAQQQKGSSLNLSATPRMLFAPMTVICVNMVTEIEFDNPAQSPDPAADPFLFPRPQEPCSTEDHSANIQEHQGSDDQQDLSPSESEGGAQSDDNEIEDVPLSYQIPDDELRTAMQTSPSSGAAYWRHTMYRGLQGERVIVHYCRNRQASENVAQLFLDKRVLGFDIEWKPQTLPAEGVKSNVSLIQLACEDRIALFHISLHRGETADELLAPTLKQILESPSIIKAGVAVRADFSRIQKYLHVQARGIFELSHLNNLVTYSSHAPHLVNKRLVSLARHVSEHLQLPLYKGDVRQSDWSKELTHEQQTYAATDAYAGFQLYHALEAKRKRLDPVPPRPEFAELNRPIRLADGARVAARQEVEDSEVEELAADVADKFTLEAGEANLNEALNVNATALADEPRSPDDTTSEPTFVGRFRFTGEPPSPAPVKPLRAPQLLQAEAWVAEWRACLPEGYKPRATQAQLRAYALWHYQHLTIEEVASLLRDPPLQPSTVSEYILGAIRSETLDFNPVRVKDILDGMPTEVVQGRYRALWRKVRGL